MKFKLIKVKNALLATSVTLSLCAFALPSLAQDDSELLPDPRPYLEHVNDPIDPLIPVVLTGPDERKVRKCAITAAANANKHPNPVSGYYIELGKCIGITTVTDNGPEIICIVYPDYCKKGNPCQIQNGDATDCQHCVSLKYAVNLMKGMNPGLAKNTATIALIDCDAA